MCSYSKFNYLKEHSREYIWKFTAINLNRPDEPVAGSIPVAAALERVGMDPGKLPPFPVKKKHLGGVGLTRSTQVRVSSEARVRIPQVLSFFLLVLSIGINLNAIPIPIPNPNP